MQGEVSEVADGAPAKEKPQAGMLKKYSHAEHSNVPDTPPAKEKPDAGMLRRYTQGELSDAKEAK